MNIKHANELLQDYIQTSSNRLEYLLKLDDILDVFRINFIDNQIDIFDERKWDFVHSHEDGMFTGVLEKERHQLEFKTVGIEHVEHSHLNLHINSVDMVEGIRDEFNIEQVFLINGMRTGIDDFEGVYLDSNELSRMLEISKEEGAILRRLLIEDFRMFEKLFPEKY